MGAHLSIFARESIFIVINSHTALNEGSHLFLWLLLLTQHNLAVVLAFQLTIPITIETSFSNLIIFSSFSYAINDCWARII